MEKTTADKTTQNLADELAISTRMVNLYRAAAEKLCGYKLGTRRGKTVYFSKEEQDLIIAARYNALDTLKSAAREEEEKPEVPQNFSESGSSLQEELAGGLIGMRESLHSGGVSLGRNIGKEFAAGLRQGIGMELQALIIDLEIVSDNLLKVSSGAASLPTSAEETRLIPGAGACFW